MVLAGLDVTFSRKEREGALRPDGTQSPAEGRGRAVRDAVQFGPGPRCRPQGLGMVGTLQLARGGKAGVSGARRRLGTFDWSQLALCLRGMACPAQAHVKPGLEHGAGWWVPWAPR